MSNKEQRISIKNKIKKYLEQYPSLRDDVFRTLVNYYHFQLHAKGKNINNLSVPEFFQMIEKRELDNLVTVYKSWQNVIRENVDLRGPKWEIRQNLGKEIRKEHGT